MCFSVYTTISQVKAMVNGTVIAIVLYNINFLVLHNLQKFSVPLYVLDSSSITHFKKNFSFYKLTSRIITLILVKKKSGTSIYKFAKKFTYITDETVNIILNARDTILIHDEGTWSKKSGLFDIPMGAFDSAEITDLVGLFILYIFKDKIKEIDFGLYREDMLGFLKNMP